MSFTYDVTDIEKPINFIRYHIQDVDSAGPIHQDEDIQAAIKLEGTKELAVIQLLENELATLQRAIDLTISGITLQQQTRLNSLKYLINAKKARFLGSGSAATVNVTRNYG